MSFFPNFDDTRFLAWLLCYFQEVWLFYLSNGPKKSGSLQTPFQFMWSYHMVFFDIHCGKIACSVNRTCWWPTFNMWCIFCIVMVDTIISPASFKAWKIPLARFTDGGLWLVLLYKTFLDIIQPGHFHQVKQMVFQTWESIFNKLWTVVIEV